MSHIFISYSRKDFDFAQKIVNALVANDLDTWIDWKSIPKGEDWWEHIQNGIEEADAFLFLVSPDSVASQICRKEIDHAAKNGKRILPVDLRNDGTQSPHPEISKRSWIRCREGQDDFAAAIIEICNTIRTDYEWLQYHTHLQVRALEWERTRDAGRLLQGKGLQEAQTQLAKRFEDPRPTDLQRNYLEASLKEMERKRKLWISSSAVGLVMVLFLVIFERDQSILAKERASIARAVELAAQSAVLRESDPTVSMLLGLEAFAIQESLQTLSVVRDNAQSNGQLNRVAQWTVKSPYDPLHQLVFSPDNRIVAIQVGNNRVLLRDTETGNLLAQPLGDYFVGEGIAFRPGANIVALGDKENNIVLFDTESGRPVGQPLRGHTSVINFLVFSPDGKMLASVSRDNTIRLWNVEAGKSIGKLEIDWYVSIKDIVFRSDKKALILNGPFSEVIEWDLETNHSSSRSWDEHTRTDALAISPDGKRVASQTESGEIFLWNIESGAPIDQPLSGYSGTVTSAAFSPDGTLLATTSAERTIKLWDAETGEQIGTSLFGHVADETPSLAFSPDGSFLASGGTDGKIIFWDLKEVGSNRIFVEGYPGILPTNIIYSVALSPDGKTLATGSQDGVVLLWDMETRKMVGQPLSGHSDAVVSIAISPDGKMMASGSRDEEVILWNLDSKQIVQLVSGYSGSVHSLSFSPDGTLLAYGGLEGTLIWDVRSRQLVDILSNEPGRSISSIAFSPDGKTLAVSAGQDAIFWDTSSEQIVEDQLNPPDIAIEILAYSPDSKILGGSFNDTINLWDIETGQPVGQPLRGHFGRVESVTFSPDGKTLASAGWGDNTIFLWDVQTGQAVGQPLSGHADGIYSIVYSLDGKKLVSGSRDETVIVWDMDHRSLLEKTCQRAGRNFTLSEWQQYFPGEEYRLTCPQWPPRD